MLVSIAIPVKDDIRIFDCVAALQAGRDVDADVEIIVVDNCSEPDFRNRLNGLGPGVKVFDEPRPGSFAARNRAVEAASGDIILSTDSDCLPRPDWVGQAISALEKTGADIVQGFSGAKAERGSVGELIQLRYGARFRGLPLGHPTECDTRNMAVRKEVFETVRFNADFRRVGDTELGLVAESLGFRVGYAPAMRVDHEHDDHLDTFVAKQICHGWGAQRLMTEHPELRWHGGNLKMVALTVGWVSRIPGRRTAAEALAGLVIAGSRTLEERHTALPSSAVHTALLGLDKLALLSGHLMHEPGAPEPAPSQFLGRNLPRE